jgi:hypothetical protein
MASSHAGFLNPGAHAACEEYLHHASENQQRAERPRESNNPPRFNDRFSRSDPNFFRPRGHAHLRMYQRGDPGSHQQNSHNRNRMEFHINKSALAETTHLLCQRMNNLAQIIGAAGVALDVRVTQSSMIVHLHRAELRPIRHDQLNGRRR